MLHLSHKRLHAASDFADLNHDRVLRRLKLRQEVDHHVAVGFLVFEHLSEKERERQENNRKDDPHNAELARG
jgi:hypothetical protein